MDGSSEKTCHLKLNYLAYRRDREQYFGDPLYMTASIPSIDSSIQDTLIAMKTDEKIANALQIAVDETQESLQEQVAICEIPAPTFEEGVRAAEVAKRLKDYGCENVEIDSIGNVIAYFPGDEKGPVLAIGAHLDTVFPAGTDVKVKIEGHRYTAPGIGDNCSGIRALLQVVRCLKKTGIQTHGDLYLIFPVGEEGLGDTRGAKHFLATHHVDGFIAIDNTEIGRILKGAVGSHRYRITFTGPGGHSYAHFGKVPSAIHAMCIAGAKMAHVKVPANPKTTFTIGKISGGTSVNTIAPTCEVEIDMRSIDNNELLGLEAKVLQCFEEALAEENAIWNITDPERQVKMTRTPIGDRPAGIRPDDCPVLQCARAALESLGQPLTNYGFSSTDANMAVSLGIPATCLSSGGFQYKSHSVAEYFDAIDIHLGPQLILLTALSLVGYGKFQPKLPLRSE